MAKRTILAVDDEPMVTRLAQVNLQRVGYVVKTASNGIEGLEALRSGEPLPDMILLDVTMPFMDGFEMVNQMQADPKLKDIPVVMATARAHDADLVQGQAVGVTHYLTKPINPTELVNIVREVIGEAEYEPESA